MRKISILLALILSINVFGSLDIDKAKIELKDIKKEIIEKYKEELKMDFNDISKKSANEVRIFKETLYLKFLSKYVEDITDVKIYSSKEAINFLIFANNKIDREDFEKLFDIIYEENDKIKLKLIQVPSENGRVKYFDIIQEKLSERE